MCKYNHELCQHDLRGMSKHEVNQHYFEFVRNATKEEYDENGWCITSTRGLYECRICGKKHSFVKGNFKKHLQFCKNGCNGCKRGDSGNIVIVGYNNVGITDPDLVPFFVNPEDGYTHTRCSSDKSNMVCPHCGHIELKIIKNLTRQGFSCSCCDDGMSYPEKLFALVLKALGVDFTRQETYDNGQHRYDFYVTLWKAIFETHGIQHYEGWNRSEEDLIRQQNNDKEKRVIAIDNGILNENYHEVDCRYSTLEWCRQNIKEALNKYIDINILTDKDWNEFDKQAQKSLKLDVCKYWKKVKDNGENLTTVDLAKEFGVAIKTIIDYLKWGNKESLCEYNADQEKQNRIKRQSVEVLLLKPNGEKWFEKPMSQKELARQSGISMGTIGNYRESGKPLTGKPNTKYDKKYAGSYVVSAEEYDLKFNKNNSDSKIA